MAKVQLYLSVILAFSLGNSNLLLVLLVFCCIFRRNASANYKPQNLDLSHARCSCPESLQNHFTQPGLIVFGAFLILFIFF